MKQAFGPYTILGLGRRISLDPAVLGRVRRRDQLGANHRVTPRYEPICGQPLADVHHDALGELVPSPAHPRSPSWCIRRVPDNPRRTGRQCYRAEAWRPIFAMVGPLSVNHCYLRGCSVAIPPVVAGGRVDPFLFRLKGSNSAAMTHISATWSISSTNSLSRVRFIDAPGSRSIRSTHSMVSGNPVGTLHAFSLFAQTFLGCYRWRVFGSSITACVTPFLRCRLI